MNARFVNALGIGTGSLVLAILLWVSASHATRGENLASIDCFSGGQRIYTAASVSQIRGSDNGFIYFTTVAYNRVGVHGDCIVEYHK